MAKNSFTTEVYKVMESVPPGRVITYKKIAVLCGNPLAARQVGQIAHFGSDKLPWHRLVKSTGDLASGFVPGGPLQQKKMLEDEGIIIINNKVSLKDYTL